MDKFKFLFKSNEQDPTFWTDDETTTLLGALVDGLDDVNQLLLVLQYPIQLIIVTRPKIAHHVFIAVKEHDRHGIIKLVHRVEIGDLVDVAQVDDGKVYVRRSGQQLDVFLVVLSATDSSHARQSCRGIHLGGYLSTTS